MMADPANKSGFQRVQTHGFAFRIMGISIRLWYVAVIVIFALGCVSPDTPHAPPRANPIPDRPPQDGPQAVTRLLMQRMQRFDESLSARNAPVRLDKDYSTIVRPLIEELRTLTADATRDDFYKRPAMSKLMGMGRNAFPTLKEIFLKDDDWAIKVSVGFLVVALDGVQDCEVLSRLSAFHKDPHPAVRALAASYLEGRGQFCGFERAQYFQAHPRELEISDRFGGFTPWLWWMAPEDAAARQEQVLAVIEQGDPYIKPAAWVDGISVLQGDSGSLWHVSNRMLTRDQDMAERFLHQAFYSTCAHDLRMALMDRLERDDGRDPQRLGRKLSLAGTSLGHPLSVHECRTFLQELRNRLFAVCERWAWKATDAQALRSIVDGIPASLEKGRALVADLEKRHPNAQVREFARMKLRNYADSRAQEELNRRR